MGSETQFCCDSPCLFKDSEELLICKNCGALIEYEDIDESYSNTNIYRQNGSINVTCNNVNTTKYSVDPNSVKYTKRAQVFELLKNKNTNSQIVKLHDNYLKRATEIFIEVTKKKILRANNREEAISYVLSRICMSSDVPITNPSLVRYMRLPKGGNSRGKKICQNDEYINKILLIDNYF